MQKTYQTGQETVSDWWNVGLLENQLTAPHHMGSASIWFAQSSELQQWNIDVLSRMLELSAGLHDHTVRHKEENLASSLLLNQSWSYHLLLMNHILNWWVFFSFLQLSTSFSTCLNCSTPKQISVGWFICRPERDHAFLNHDMFDDCFYLMERNQSDGWCLPCYVMLCSMPSCTSRSHEDTKMQLYNQSQDLQQVSDVHRVRIKLLQYWKGFWMQISGWIIGLH